MENGGIIVDCTGQKTEMAKGEINLQQKEKTTLDFNGHTTEHHGNCDDIPLQKINGHVGPQLPNKMNLTEYLPNGHVTSDVDETSTDVDDVAELRCSTSRSKQPRTNTAMISEVFGFLKTDSFREGNLSECLEDSDITDVEKINTCSLTSTSDSQSGVERGNTCGYPSESVVSEGTSECATKKSDMRGDQTASSVIESQSEKHNLCGDNVMSGVRELNITSAESSAKGVTDVCTSADDVEKKKTVTMRHSQRPVSKQTCVDDQDDSSDDDKGVYDETIRRSKWIRVDDDGQFSVIGHSELDSPGKMSCAIDDHKSCDTEVSALRDSTTDEVFARNGSLSPRIIKTHQRSDSCSTTLSEREFKREFSSKRKCIIQRNDSQQEYHRFSCKMYDQEKVVTIQKTDTDSDFGLHLLDCPPVFISSVDPGSPAHRAGIVEGQIIIAVNGVNVLESPLSELLELIQQTPSTVKLEVAHSDYQPVRDIQSTVFEGYMYKLGSSTLVKKWNKRYFILRHDNCLYYYKTEKDIDPLGAVPLSGYSILRYLDTNKDFCFKAEKYNARTYYFMTDSRDEMTAWFGKLTEAAARSKKRKDSWLDVSSHNVGLPALEIRRPECTGYLIKCAPRYKTWKKRYCVLKDACIYYYKNMNSFNAQGVAHLHGYTVDAGFNTSKRYSFVLVPPEEPMRKFFFQAENETDKNRWVEALTKSIRRWKKAD